MSDPKLIEIYSSRDRIRNEMLNLAKNYLDLENFDFQKSSYLSYLINVLSMLDSNLMYYTNSIHREYFLTTAMQKESILNWSSILGYDHDLNLAKSAKVRVLLEIPISKNMHSALNNNDQLVINLQGRNNTSPGIEPYKVYSTDNIPFTLDNTTIVTIRSSSDINIVQNLVGSQSGTQSIDYRFENNSIKFYLNFTQIVNEEQTFTIPQLLPNEFYNITMNFTEMGDISDMELFTVYSQSGDIRERWSRANSIFGISPNESIYSYRHIDEGIVISFGNGVIGRQPERGTEILVNASLTRGSKGNVISGSIRSSDNVSVALNPEMGGSAELFTTGYSIKVINTSPAYGGKDSPTIDEIRTNTMKSVTMNKRLVTANDFNNSDLILQDLPINNIHQVLKRSDLKRNEIILYTDVVYNNAIVPTRNAFYKKQIGEDNSVIHLKANEVIEEMILEGQDEDYLTLFDIEVNPVTREANYYYILDMIRLPIILMSQTTLNNSEIDNNILPMFVELQTIRNENDEHLDIKLYTLLTNSSIYDLVDPLNSEFYDYKFNLEIEWEQELNNELKNVFTLEFDPEFSTESDIMVYHATDNGDLFLDLENIPSNKNLKFKFKLYKDNEGEDELLNISEATGMIKRNLTNFMYSQVFIDGTGSNRELYLYDVPVIKKSYYDGIFDKSDFTHQIYNKLINFDIYQYKMITDFVNLKFANTTGVSTNMQYNKKDHSISRRIRWPENSTSLEEIHIYMLANHPKGFIYTGDDVLFGNEYNLKNGTIIIPNSQYQYGSNTNMWIFREVRLNDIIHIDEYLNHEEQSYIFNGRDLVSPVHEIPLKIHLSVIPTESITITPPTLVKNIRETLIDELSPNFGYNRPIYISNIIRIVQGVYGVQNCKVLSPDHDIFFNNEEQENIKQKDLLKYTPELTYITLNNIQVDIKS